MAGAPVVVEVLEALTVPLALPAVALVEMLASAATVLAPAADVPLSAAALPPAPLGDTPMLIEIVSA